MITALAFAPSDPNTQYAGTFIGTVWRTLDNGANWHEIDWTGRPGTGVNDLAVAPDDKYKVYVAYGGWLVNSLFRARKVGTGGSVTAVASAQAPHSQDPPPMASSSATRSASFEPPTAASTGGRSTAGSPMCR
jgi:hypothetical protein